MDIQQVEWAAQHDWYVDNASTESAGQFVVIVRDWEPQVSADGEQKMVAVRNCFGDFAELKAWAGY